MTTETDIDELLRQDEAELKAKRRRLKSFATALEELRRAAGAATHSVDELLNAGDLSRADLGRVFKLTKSERAALIPTRRGAASDTSGQLEAAATTDAREPADAPDHAE